jgi:release factor glutamine methyltransferase
MIAHLQISKEKLMRETELTVSSSDEERIRTGYHQYVDEKIPLEYVLGYVAFLERRFHVNGNTLIPRPETEYMILAVKEALEAD